MFKLNIFLLTIMSIFCLVSCSTVEEKNKNQSSQITEEPFRSGERTNYNPGNGDFNKTKNKTRYCTYHDDDGFAYEAPCGKP
ncbi:hypothetical protein N5853_00785 [Bartonella sp. HY329]|uniref:hypothetical protein n=1 Tax=unclassified Bartonella TaxID=2645622 RepID=UPI0021C9637C|nr:MULTISPECIES: hypothetical protein [unclassified Bartonella]UXM95225.1 hypothetical protein N5853_00785 [Bartonella sp. HY329]UXN09549.1 hypothetical protein N5852_00790 [Bartonella sp. HY328]